MAINFPNSPANGDIFGNFTYDTSIPGWRKTPENSASLPAGTIVQWPGATAPANWLIADGAAVSRTTYASLFAAIGVQYGSGDGSTTFNLPNLKGRVPVGRDSSQTEFDTLGETGGAKTHTLQTSEMPSHTHSITDPGHSHNIPRFGGGSGGWGMVVNAGMTASQDQPYNYTAGAGTGITLASTGGGGAHNNLQPYIVLNYIIKTSAGITSSDSELATRVGAAETKANTVPLSPNMIINSDMGISQRGTTFTFGTGGGARYWPADRFNVEDYNWSAGSNITTSNDTSVVPANVGISNSMKVATGATGLTFGSGGMLRIMYSVEGRDMARLYGKNTMLSFYVRSSVAGTYSLWLANGDFGTGAFTRGYTPEYTVAQADTWQRVSIPLDFTTITSSSTWSSNTGIGMQIFWNLGAHADRTGDVYKSGWTAANGYGSKTSTSVNWATGANRTFYITGVQLEEGTNTTPYRRNQDNAQAELAASQRYCYVKNGSSTDSMWGTGRWEGNGFFCALQHPVPMRTVPSYTLLNPTGLKVVDPTVAWYNVSAIGSIHMNGTTAADVFFTMSGASVTNKTFGIMSVHSGNPQLVVSAEL